jgi:hypothetical protein
LRTPSTSRCTRCRRGRRSLRRGSSTPRGRSVRHDGNPPPITTRTFECGARSSLQRNNRPLPDGVGSGRTVPTPRCTGGVVRPQSLLVTRRPVWLGPAPLCSGFSCQGCPR